MRNFPPTLTFQLVSRIIRHVRSVPNIVVEAHLDAEPGQGFSARRAFGGLSLILDGSADLMVPESEDAAAAFVAEASARGRTLSLAGLITHREPASAADAACRTAFGDAGCLKMILDWSDMR